MTRLHRPHIPLEVRCRVAMRQLGGFEDQLKPPYRSLLKVLLVHLCEKYNCKTLQLDHDPALVLRQQSFRTVDGKLTLCFTPNANDPTYLIYRAPTDHGQKTHGLRRPDSPEFSDRVLAKRQRRRAKPKRKTNWPKRPFRRKA